FLQALDVFVDVPVDVGEHLLQILVRDVRQVWFDLGVAVRPDAELGRRRRGRRRRAGGGGIRPRARRREYANPDERDQAPHTISFGSAGPLGLPTAAGQPSSSALHYFAIFSAIQRSYAGHDVTDAAARSRPIVYVTAYVRNRLKNFNVSSGAA